MKYMLGGSCLFLAVYVYIFCQYGNCYQFINDEGMFYRMNPRTGIVERCPSNSPEWKMEKWENISYN